MFSMKDQERNTCQLYGAQGKEGYDWWWHSFTAHREETGEEKAFFLDFFLCNPMSGKEEPVFGQLPENREKGIRPSYLMVKAGTWGRDHRQLHRFFGWKKIRVSRSAPIRIKAGNCYLTEDRTYGEVSVDPAEAAEHPEWMCDGGTIRWNLKINKIIPFNVGYGAGTLMRSMQEFEMFWHAEGMKTEYEGEIWLDGVRYIVEPKTCYGYADKNWGRNFTSPWVWLSSNNLTSEISGRKLLNSVFDIGGGRPKVGPIVLERKLLSAFYYEGEEFEFNFSKFWTGVKTEFHCYETEDEIVWHVEQTNLTDRMVTDIRCPKEEMLLINYEAPNGEKRHNRLWNGGTGTGYVELYRNGILIDRVHAANVGCEYGEFDAAGPYLKNAETEREKEYLVTESNGLPMLHSRILDDLPGIRHGFTTRKGGVSIGCFDSLNLRLGSEDSPENIRENYRRLAEAFALSEDRIVTAHQTHTANIRIVTEEDAGKGITRERDYENVDGLITNVPGLLLCTGHGDCTPVFLADPVRKVVGMIHSGWKGTSLRIAEEAILVMKEKFGTRPSDVRAWIGPCICGDCYEVGPEFEEIFRETFKKPVTGSDRSAILRAKEDGRYLFDLKLANKQILTEAGIKEQNIGISAYCTMEVRELFYSHRRSGFARGNMAGAIMLEK